MRESGEIANEMRVRVSETEDRVGWMVCDTICKCRHDGITKFRDTTNIIKKKKFFVFYIFDVMVITNLPAV